MFKLGVFCLKKVAEMQKIKHRYPKIIQVIPDKINFLQFGLYCKYSEQTYRNHFEKDFDWFVIHRIFQNQAKTLHGLDTFGLDVQQNTNED